ncbi:MAG: hypothetical protein IKR77_00535 [Bacteroidales bacterium]|nr:hypothetical protein [Bacteroidales bacterium]MBR7066212.1 hypothetical protein [Prevotella sp.]
MANLLTRDRIIKGLRFFGYFSLVSGGFFIAAGIYEALIDDYQWSIDVSYGIGMIFFSFVIWGFMVFVQAASAYLDGKKPEKEEVEEV